MSNDVKSFSNKLHSFLEVSNKMFNHKHYPSFIEFDSNIRLIEEDSKELNRKYNVEMLQVKLDSSKIKSLSGMSNYMLAEQSNNRFLRFLFALLIVIFSSIACFLCVKGSIDWVN